MSKIEIVCGQMQMCIIGVQFEFILYIFCMRTYT